MLLMGMCRWWVTLLYLISSGDGWAQLTSSHLQAREIVSQSDGLEQTRALAQEYADKAIDAIRAFPDSEAKEGLAEMVTKCMTRRK